MSGKDKNGSGGYEVGRGKPPKHSRYISGQSGNPGGRKKGNLNSKTIIGELMEKDIELMENGRKRKMPIIEALYLRLAQDGLRGDRHSSLSLLDRYDRYFEAPPDSRLEPAEEDLRVIREALERLAKSAPVEADPTCDQSQSSSRRGGSTDEG